MPIRVKIVEEGFCLGTTLLPPGTIVEVNQPVRDYLVRVGKAEDFNGEYDALGTYSRRDMQAKQAQAPEDAPLPVKRKRRTKIEMERARANGAA
ncbi:MAG: hypothetical protein JRJ45_00630 [Deltaproteobacteria bacterium]|nr:hypothetical protein [Deltaproteobacteria bacterium]